MGSRREEEGSVGWPGSGIIWSNEWDCCLMQIYF
jgi:hypothetical protein